MVALAVGATALATLYPPLGASSPQSTSRYVPLPPPALAPPAPRNLPQSAPPASSGVVPDTPAFGTVVSHLAPFAGIGVPLPAGDWVTVAAVASAVPPPDGRPINQAILAQITHRRVTAIMTLTAIGLPSSPALGFQIIPGCADAGLTFNRIITAEPYGEQACWSVGPELMAWNNLRAPVQASAAAELGQRADALPQMGLHTVFIRANRSHGLKIELFQAIDMPPEGAAGWDHTHLTSLPDRMARLARLRDWIGVWWPLIDRGFAGQLQPGRNPHQGGASTLVMARRRTASDRVPASVDRQGLPRHISVEHEVDIGLRSLRG